MLCSHLSSIRHNIQLKGLLSFRHGQCDKPEYPVCEWMHALLSNTKAKKRTSLVIPNAIYMRNLRGLLVARWKKWEKWSLQLLAILLSDVINFSFLRIGKSLLFDFHVKGEGSLFLSFIRRVGQDRKKERLRCICKLVQILLL